MWGRAGRCLEAGEQSSEGLLGAVLWCLLTIRSDTGMDIDGCHMAGLCHMAGSSWQLGRHLGSRAESAGPGNRAGRRGCTVSWAILDPGHEGVHCTVSWAGEQGRPSAGQGNRAGPGNGLGNGLGDRPGLGNRVQVLWVTEFIKSLFYIKVSAAI